MRRKSNIFLGAILVVLGAIFLGFNLDIIKFDYTLKQVAAFWPIMLMLAGLAVLFHEKRSFYNPVTALLIAFAIPLAIYNVASDGVDTVKMKIKEHSNFDFDDEDWERDLGDSVDGKYGERIEQEFNVPLESSVDKVNLKIGGGAAEFHLADTDKDIFEAKTLLNSGSYKLSENIEGSVHDIEFEMKGHNNSFRINENDGHNEVYLKLNKKPNWNVEMGIGAGDLDFDMSPYKVERLEIKTGAADVDVKLGDLLNECNVKVESGVAKVHLSVPEGVGCEIDMDGALNSKDFDGFKKIDGSLYRTDNFKDASKKIYIKVSSGLSAVIVDRY